MSKRYRILPGFVATILTNYKAWLVGSAACYLAGDTDKEPADFDVVVHPDDWCKVMRHIKDSELNVKFNTFGGIKLESAGELIDIWPASIEDMTANGRDFTAYKIVPTTIVRVTNIK